FEADLLKQGSFKKAFDGVQGVFHVASPYFLKPKEDAQKELIDPALKGTENVISEALNTDTVQRIILTSSLAAVMLNQRKEGHVYTPDDWTDSATIEQTPYFLS